jgi:hypothetical protein
MSTNVALLWLTVCLFFLGVPLDALAHGVDASTSQFIEQNTGTHIGPYLYIGAKHMFTGYDHLLFLVGVLFFLHRRRDVLICITLFTVGHSVTLLFGVLYDIQANAYIIDAIIGFSVFYKGLDNLGGVKKLLGYQPNIQAMVMIFGLFHGFGLATKLQEFHLPTDGLLNNLIAFNIGVELGQLAALTCILILINAWRRHPSFQQFSTVTNTLLMAAGLALMGYQLTGFSLH